MAIEKHPLKPSIVKVLAFGTVGHGLFADHVLENAGNPHLGRGLLGPEHREKNLPLIRAVKEIADEKGVTLSQLALAWSLTKYDHVQSLIGTTNPEHPPQLKFCIEVVGADRIIHSVDCPFISNEGAKPFIEKAPISDAEKEQIAYKNAELLFGLR